MFSKTKRWVLLAINVVLVINLVVGLSAPTAGIASEMGAGGQPLYTTADISSAPQSVVDDAAYLSTQLFGEDEPEHGSFVDELLASYVKAKDKELVIFFNSGGWGDNQIEETPGWESILYGIQSQLANSGIDSLVLNYQRTIDSLQGHLGEIIELCRDYPAKAKALAYHIQFLTEHHPDLKVVITGESLGTLISGEVINILCDNVRVFSIQTGTPFWCQDANEDRTLVITDNGVTPDAFSQGNIVAIISASLHSLFSEFQAEGQQSMMYAPGHYYTWQHPAVYCQITRFFEEVIGIEETGHITEYNY